MCAESRTPVPRLGRRRAILGLAAGLAVALSGARPLAWAQGHGAGDRTADTDHDRQGWDAGRKADEAVNRAAYRRKELNNILDLDEEEWCPRTVQQVEEVLDALACYLVMREIWQNYTYDVYAPGPVDFANEFKGREDGDDASKKRHARAAAMKKTFADFKDLRDDVLDFLRRCARRRGMAVDATALDPEVRKRVEQKKQHELALIGLAPLLVVDCPQCRPKTRSIPGGVIILPVPR